DENRQGLTVFQDPYEACKDAHAVAVLTEWEEFKDYDWNRIYDNMQKPAFIFDGRGILDKKLLNNIGFIYYRIGEGAQDSIEIQSVH
ncbi:MAG: hypothetical protein HKN61_05825, partial [Flavobacteriaceae bacterium]|nr:hypothetical protein [Flavobacteriaceae bacterium]